MAKRKPANTEPAKATAAKRGKAIEDNRSTQGPDLAAGGHFAAEQGADAARRADQDLVVEQDEGYETGHRWWQSDWQPVKDAIVKWCDADRSILRGGWRMPDRITDNPYHDKIPPDVTSIEFAKWLSEQYVLAMCKGAQLAMEEMKNSP